MAKSKGFGLPARGEFDGAVFTAPDQVAAFMAKSNRIALNPGFNYGEMSKIIARDYADKFLSSEKPWHFFVHELAHAASYHDKPSVFTRLKNKAAAKPGRGLPSALKSVALQEVGWYAATDPLEFVAEVFAGLAAGKKYSEKIMGYFRIYGGTWK